MKKSISIKYLFIAILIGLWACKDTPPGIDELNQPLQQTNSSAENDTVPGNSPATNDSIAEDSPALSDSIGEDSTVPKVQIFNTENSGLPNSVVLTMAIDAQGNKWFGTYDGQLAKFDGTHWTVYDKSNSGLTGDLIYDIAIDAQDNIWIVTVDLYARTYGGLIKFDNKRWTVYSSSNSGLPDANIYCIAIDEQGNKWIGSDGKGLVKFDGLNWTTYDRVGSDILSYVSFIEIDQQGNKWLLADWNLVKFEETISTFSPLPDFSTPWAFRVWTNSLCIDANGNKWIGTSEDSDHAKGGILKYDNGNWHFYNSSNSSLPNNAFGRSAIDSQGNIWFLCFDQDKSALVKYDFINWTVFNDMNSPLPSTFLGSIAIDDQGNKWLAGPKGIVVFNENGLTMELD